MCVSESSKCVYVCACRCLFVCVHEGDMSFQKLMSQTGTDETERAG